MLMLTMLDTNLNLTFSMLTTVIAMGGGGGNHK